MRVVDTSAWIEAFVKGRGPQLLSRFPGRDQCAVPTIVQHELAKWLLREAGAQERRRVLGYAGKCVVIQLSSELALFSAELGRAHKLATADAIIYATARLHGADLLTCDAHFENLPGVLYVPKLQG